MVETRTRRSTRTNQNNDNDGSASGTLPSQDGTPDHAKTEGSLTFSDDPLRRLFCERHDEITTGPDLNSPGPKATKKPDPIDIHRQVHETCLQNIQGYLKKREKGFMGAVLAKGTATLMYDDQRKWEQTQNARESPGRAQVESALL
jgi:hypothetical protein